MTEEIELREDERAARLLSTLGPPSPIVVARVRSRLSAQKPTQSVTRLLGVGLTTALAAASVLFLIGRSLEPVAPRPVALAASLEAPGGWAIETKVPGVALSYEGTGTMSGQSDAPLIVWEAGTLNVEVVPERGIRLAVQTGEAAVRVIGTGFTVERDALGTTVSVRHGRVEVDCSNQLTRVLEAGESVNCLPTTASGLLFRATTLRTRGASHAEVLATVDRALALPDASGAIGDDLAATRVFSLLSLGRSQEALEDSKGYLLNRPSAARRADVTRMAAAAAEALGGCAAVAPWLLDAAPAACK